MIDWLNATVELHAVAGWVLPAVFLLAAADGLLPPLPSDSVIIALAAVTAAAAGPHPTALAATAAGGALLGDALTHAFGARLSQRGRGRPRANPAPTALDRARRLLLERGAVVVLVARFVPIARAVVNLAAGAVGFSRRRFLAVSSLAGATWASYLVAIGSLAGHWVRDNPLLGAAAAIGLATALGIAVDRTVSRRSDQLVVPAKGKAARSRPRPAPDGPGRSARTRPAVDTSCTGATPRSDG